MNHSKFVALLGSTITAVALCVCSAVHAADEPKGPHVSDFLVKPLQAAQDALKTQNWDLEISKLNEAQAAKGQKTSYDEYLINAMLGAAYANKHDNDDAAPALQAAAESQDATPEQRRAWLRAVGKIYYQEKQYAKAIEVDQELLKDGASDADLYTTIALAQNALGKYQDAAATIEQVTDKEPKPEEKFLQFQWDAYTKANDQADASKVMDKLVMYYPKPDYWLNALHPLLQNDSNDPNLQLGVFRLMNDVGALKQPRDYAEMAELTFAAGFPGETVAILEKAFANNVFTDPGDVMRYQHLLAGSKQKATADEASLPGQQRAAQRSSTGDALVAVGAAYLSYGQPDMAVQVLSQGIAKGGLKSPEQATLLLGIAQLRSHNSAEAHGTFDKVASSSNEGYAQLGKLWVLYSGSQA